MNRFLKALIDMFPNQSKRKKNFYKEMEKTPSEEMQDKLELIQPTIIHTRTFSCANDHPIVYYTFDKNNKAMCEYCSTYFVYEDYDDENEKTNT